MKWDSVGDFIAMGGYGLYVWGSFVVTAVLVAVEIAVLAARHRAAMRRPPEPPLRGDDPQ